MKKTFKYIFSLALILSSFFFIDSVFAASDAKICIYDYEGNDDNIHIVIRDNGSAYIADVKNHENGSLLNWDNADKGGFKGKDYFYSHDYACPPYAVVNVDNVGANDIYMSDKDSLSKIDSAIWGEVNCKLVGDGLINTAPDEIKKSSSYTFTVPKDCLCETNSSLSSNAEYDFSVNFTVNKILSRPSVSIKYGGSSNSENLHNWYIKDFYNLGNYSYVKDIAKTNSCPEYVVYDTKGNSWVAVSDSASLNSVLKEADKGFAAKCHEVQKPVSNSNSNKPSNSNASSTSNRSNSTSTSNSNHNADFMIIDQYKQCGGSAGALITNIPSIVPRITSTLYNSIMVLVPVILIIMGTVDLVKGIMSQKEDEMKKGRETFIKRIVGAVIIFLLVLIVKIFVGAVSRDGKNSVRIVNCIDCFVSNSCDTMSK